MTCCTGRPGAAKTAGQVIDPGGKLRAERLADLQVTFQHHMPRGWLRDELGQTLPAAPSPY